ncbi:MAG: Gldg family protein [Bacteriovoracales bacterium]|nr:Gldg family protein [Bacteriovoracales bacterium]
MTSLEKLIDQFLFGVNFILYLLCLFLWLVLPSYIALNISVCIFTLCLTTILIFKKRQGVERYLKSTHYQHLMRYSVQAFLLFCIFGLINYLVYKNPFQWDLTSNKINSLHKQTIQILKKIEHPISFKVYAKRKNATAILALLELYRLENSLLKVELIDPEINPLKVKRDQIKKYGQIKVDFKDRSVKFLDYSERGITNSLLKVLRNRESVISFIQGHRSASINAEKPDGLSKLKNYLESEGHKVDEISFDELGKISLESSVAVLWGPKDGLTEKELNSLQKFLQKKGNLMMALDPQIHFDPFTKLRNLMAKERSITIANDLVVDSLSSVPDSGGSIPVIKAFDLQHPVTAGMEGEVFFPLVSSIQFLKDSKTDIFRLAQTSRFPKSWAERNFDEVKKKKVSFNGQSDLMGPVTVMGASQSEKGRVLLIGNSSFVYNRYFDFQNNFLLFSNAVSWLLEQNDLISFSRPKSSHEKPIFSAPAMNVLFYFSVIFMPLIFLTMAVFCYRRKMKL